MASEINNVNVEKLNAELDRIKDELKEKLEKTRNQITRDRIESALKNIRSLEEVVALASDYFKQHKRAASFILPIGLKKYNKGSVNKTLYVIRIKRDFSMSLEFYPSKWLNHNVTFIEG